MTLKRFYWFLSITLFLVSCKNRSFEESSVAGVAVGTCDTRRVVIFAERRFNTTKLCWYTKSADLIKPGWWGKKKWGPETVLQVGSSTPILESEYRKSIEKFEVTSLNSNDIELAQKDCLISEDEAGVLSQEAHHFGPPVFYVYDLNIKRQNLTISYMGGVDYPGS